MNLIHFKYSTDIYCTKCDKLTSCLECSSELEYCFHCGEPIERHECFIIFTDDKYHGADELCSRTATLIIDGEQRAYAYVDRRKNEKDPSGDVGHMHLGFIPESLQTDIGASIFAAFAKWVRFDWESPEKKTPYPTLVRLMGATIDKTQKMWPITWWVALADATQIKKEHLVREFTSKEII